MAFCAKCGADVQGAAFCPKCGAAQGATAAPAAATASGSTGLTENVAGLLCYVAWWVTGLIFFLIDKRPFVRFHAAQAMVLFGSIVVLAILLTFLNIGSMFGGWILWAFTTLLWGVIWLGSLIMWIMCMIKAYQGEKFKVPVVGDLAEKIAGNA